MKKKKKKSIRYALEKFPEVEKLAWRDERGSVLRNIKGTGKQ